MPGRSGKATAIICSVVVACYLSGAVGIAQSKSANLQAERQQLFNQMMQQPDNLEIAFSYASLSVRVGDLEGAVSTLERMLIFSPGLARLQMELGVLYYRLGSFEMSRSYLKAVISGSSTSPEILQRAQEYLAAVEKKLERFVWSMNRFVGLRWQSNANMAPDTNNIDLNGVTFALSNSLSKKSDHSVVTSGQVHLEYDLYNQGDKIELDYVDFGILHFNQTRFDTGISEVTVGPSFNLGRFDIDGTFAGIYAIANGAVLNGRRYFGTLGVGTRIVSRLQDDLELVIKAEYRHQWFNNTSRRVASTDRNGDEFRGVGEIKYMFADNFRGSFGTRVSRRDRRAAFLDHWEYGVEARFDWMFNPLNTLALPWTLTATAGYLHRDYDDPDPAINANRRQKDNEYRIGGVLKVPVTRAWAIMPKVEYRQINSNNPFRDYKVYTATIGVQFSL